MLLLLLRLLLQSRARCTSQRRCAGGLRGGGCRRVVRQPLLLLLLLLFEPVLDRDAEGSLRRVGRRDLCAQIREQRERVWSAGKVDEVLEDAEHAKLFFEVRLERARGFF